MLVAVYSFGDEILASLSESFISTRVTEVSDLRDHEPAGGWDALVVDVSSGGQSGWSFARRAEEEFAGLPILAVVDEADISRASDLADFVVAPANREELAARLRRLGGESAPDELVRFKDLELNLATYQATIAGEPVDLTFMEYELLRFFATHPTRVWSRQQILSKVWGYDYFGGSRTVDVHVRRLRAKLGEERSSWITTVRSVGYRFG